jgi:predicted NBD/HSP70 family sugar kinase
VGADAVITTILDAVDELAAAVGMPPAAFTSLGVGMPGQVAREARWSPMRSTSASTSSICPRAGPRLGIPVRAENDVEGRCRRCLGAARCGHADVDGVPQSRHRHRRRVRARRPTLAGRPRSRGEVGHISVDPTGPSAAADSVLHRGLQRGAAVAERWGWPAALPVRDVFDAADAGDPLAVQLRRGLAYGVASAIRVIVLSTDVDAVVLGEASRRSATVC